MNNHNLQDHNYIISTLMGELRRNRQHLMQILDSEISDSRLEQTPQQEITVATERYIPYICILVDQLALYLYHLMGLLLIPLEHLRLLERGM